MRLIKNLNNEIDSLSSSELKRFCKLVSKLLLFSIVFLLVSLFM